MFSIISLSVLGQLICSWVRFKGNLRAQFSWLWEYKRKKRKIPKKEREKEKKKGFPDLLVP